MKSYRCTRRLSAFDLTIEEILCTVNHPITRNTKQVTNVSSLNFEIKAKAHLFFINLKLKSLNVFELLRLELRVWDICYSDNLV